MKRSDRFALLAVACFIFAGLFFIERRVEAMESACLNHRIPVRKAVGLNEQEVRLSTLEGQIEFLDRSVEKIWNEEGTR